jgi:hypothetical protein
VRPARDASESSARRPRAGRGGHAPLALTAPGRGCVWQPRCQAPRPPPTASTVNVRSRPLGRPTRTTSPVRAPLSGLPMGEPRDTSPGGDSDVRLPMSWYSMVRPASSAARIVDPGRLRHRIWCAGHRGPSHNGRDPRAARFVAGRSRSPRVPRGDRRHRWCSHPRARYEAAARGRCGERRARPRARPRARRTRRWTSPHPSAPGMSVGGGRSGHQGSIYGRAGQHRRGPRRRG